jgi:hypothetical protein
MFPLPGRQNKHVKCQPRFIKKTWAGTWSTCKILIYRNYSCLPSDQRAELDTWDREQSDHVHCRGDQNNHT